MRRGRSRESLGGAEGDAAAGVGGPPPPLEAQLATAREHEAALASELAALKTRLQARAAVAGRPWRARLRLAHGVLSANERD